MSKNVNQLKKSELVKLLGGLRKLNAINDNYIQTFLEQDTDIQPSLERYKKQIELASRYDPQYIHESKSYDYDIDKCIIALKSYLSASDNNLEGYIELLIYTIECFHIITSEYPDIDEYYYEEIEEWYLEASKSIAKLYDNGINRIDLIEDLQKIRDSASSISCWYQDGVAQIFKKHLLKYVK